MKRSFAALFFALLIPAAAAADIHGSWTAEKMDGNTIQLDLARPHSHRGETMKLAAFTGLPAPVLDAKTQTPVKFALRRDAGTIAFEGTFKDGDGAGQFTFTPNAAFVAALRDLNVTFKDGKLDDERLLTMALADVSSAYIRSMQAEGYRVSGEKYFAMRIHGIDANYVRRMNALR